MVPNSDLNRPVAFFSWLKYDTPLNLAGVEIIPRGQIDNFLNADTAVAVRAMLDCFVEQWGSNGVRAAGHMVALCASGSPSDEIEREAQLRRIGYVSDALGAVVAADARQFDASAEVVQPHVFRVIPDPNFGLVIPRARGGLTATSTQTYRVYRQPWVTERVILLTNVAHDTLRVLEQLIEDALASSNRADEILRSLRWFIQAHEYNLHRRADTNIGAIGTALEILLNLTHDDDKKRALRQKVKDLTGSEALAAQARDLYAERSEVTHTGQAVTPLLPDRHMAYLEFGWELYWLCLRLTLEQEYGAAFADKADRTWRLEQSCASIAHRLTQLTKLSVRRVARDKSRHVEVIELLKALHVNPNDTSGPPQLCVDALRNVCRIIAAVLSERSSAGLDTPEIEADMADMADHIESIATNLDAMDPLDGYQLYQAIAPSYRICLSVPVLAERSLQDLFFNEPDLVSGLADLLAEHRTYSWPGT